MSMVSPYFRRGPHVRTMAGGGGGTQNSLALPSFGRVFIMSTLSIASIGQERDGVGTDLYSGGAPSSSELRLASAASY